MHGYIALTILMSALQAVGQAMQKHGIATQLPQITLRQLLSQLGEFLGAMLTNWVWVVGFLFTVVGSIVGVQAISMGDLSVVKPLIKLQDVFVVLIGVAILRERLVSREWIGVGVMLAGAAVLTVGAGPSTNIVPGTMTSMMLFLATIVLTGLLYVLHRRWPARFTAEFALALGAGLLFGVGDLMVKASTGIVKHEIGSFSVLHGAAIKAALATPELQINIVVNLIGFMMVQTAFSNGRVSFIGPLVGLGATLFPVLAGFAVFDERPYPVRVIGIAAMMVGTAFLISREAHAAAESIPALAAAPRLPEAD
jgi:uncharacterized membrane protein